MKLNEVSKGKKVLIKEVETTCNCVLRLMTLGLIEGTSVTVISSTESNIELRIYKSGVLAISRHCAEKIIVV